MQRKIALGTYFSQLNKSNSVTFILDILQKCINKLLYTLKQFLTTPAVVPSVVYISLQRFLSLNNFLSDVFLCYSCRTRNSGMIPVCDILEYFILHLQDFFLYNSRQVQNVFLEM